MLSPLEIGAVLAVVVLLFGVKRLPELGSGLGEAISNFRKSYREGIAIDVTPSEADKQSETKATQSKVDEKGTDSKDAGS
jgi:sec-independent protein translocase protein TatA